MADIANLVLAVDSSQVKTGTASLDGLTAAGARAEAATVGLRTGVKSAGVEASAMAVAAQASARAAMDQASGFRVATDAARVNTIAMRETLVVARELSRGNFTRIPGSLTLLAQGVSSGGGLAAFAQALGLIKQVQNAELAEAATAAATSAAAIESAARRAAANITAADTEVALAEAAIRVAESSEAEAVAQTRLAAAHEAVALAATEAKIAEDALAVAQGRAMEAGNAAAATTRTTLGTTGAVLVAVGIAATSAALGFEAIKTQVADSGVLERYADSLGLSAKQLDALKQKTDDFALTFGDVWNGIKKAASDALDQSDAWKNFKSGNESAFKAALDYAVDFASKAYGYVAASYDTIVGLWHNFPNDLGSAFVSAVNIAITEINKLVQAAVAGLNFVIAGANKIPGVDIGNVSAPQIGLVKGPSGSAKPGLSFSQDAAKRAAEAKAKINDSLDTIYGDIIDAAEERIKKLGGTPPKPKKPKKPKINAADEELAKLDAQIAGENALAQAYLTSDAAAIKAEADQKAMTLAVEKHATAAQTAALKEKELALAIATTAAQGAKHVADLTFEADARKHVNDMIAAGLLPASHANAQLQLENELRPLVAAASLAEGTAKQNILNIITKLTQAYKDNNDEIARGNALRNIAANDNEIAKLQLENSLLGVSNKERATALAQLEAQQYLNDNQISDPLLRAQYTQSEVAKAVAGIQTPFQQWAKDIPQTASAITEALQGIEVKGLDGLSTAIAAVVTGTESLKQAFSDLARSVIADIVQMTIKMLLFRALSSVFPGLFGGGNTGNPGASVMLASARGNVFLGGNVVPFASGGVVSSPTLFPMNGGRTGLMGEAGEEAVMPLARDSRGRLGVRAANNNAQVIEVVISTTPSDQAWAQVESVSVRSAAAVVGKAAPVIVKAAVNGTMRAANRPKLMGRG